MKNSLSACGSEFSKIIKDSRFTDIQGIERSLEQGTRAALDLLLTTKRGGGNVYIIGNGGSASVASHIANDFCNIGELRVMTLHEPTSLTCFTNDYGYERAYAVQIEKMARKGDLIIAISSSGKSRNIVNAAVAMRNYAGYVITLSGFSATNPLRHIGDLNYWVPSHEYGLVEIAHLFALHHWSDRMGFEWAATDKIVSLAN